MDEFYGGKPAGSGAGKKLVSALLVLAIMAVTAFSAIGIYKLSTEKRTATQPAASEVSGGNAAGSSGTAGGTVNISGYDLDIVPSQVAAKVIPSVVCIQNYQQSQSQLPFAQTLSGEEQLTLAAEGSGIVYTEDGYIITNAHVIAGGTSCYVALADGSIFDAALVGYDAEQDLAVIKAQDTDGRAAQGLPAAEFGDSDALSVGDPVYAIGNPLGVELRGTLTDGIVSAINRDVDVDGVTMTLIQTNAALNNGNSGGPLINRYGQVIGINVMKMGMDRWSTASVEGLGFAIPIASSAYIVNDILRCGEVQGEPVLGISVDRTPAYLPDGQQAARVYTVDLNGPGDKAGLEVDDLIYEADGVRVETSNDLLRVRHRHAAGEEMILKVCRGGEYLTVSVTLEAKR